MSHDDPDRSDEDRKKEALTNALSYAASETLVLAKYEVAHKGMFPSLWPDDDDGEFDKAVNRVVEHLGGPPDAYLVRTGRTPPPADNYPEATMKEAFAVFSRARKSILRAHLFMEGSLSLSVEPEAMGFVGGSEVARVFADGAERAFWEHAEASFIRLYSYWDRVGQVLDFAFFNIRKFDQNGFNAVMDRIHSNVIPMDSRIKNSGSWRHLRAFQTSEKEDGLKWLLQRRNLIVHSLHLHPVHTGEEDVFKSQFNHLDIAHRERLRPRSPADEIAILVSQLGRAASLFNAFLNLLEHSSSRKQESVLY